MSKFLVLVLILGFLGVAIIGISIMGSHNDCLFGKLSACTYDALAMINAHFSAFKALSMAVFGRLIAAITILISFLVLLLAFKLSRLKLCLVSDDEPPLPPQSFQDNYWEIIRCWLSLHENSPSFSLARI